MTLRGFVVAVVLRILEENAESAGKFQKRRERGTFEGGEEIRVAGRSFEGFLGPRLGVDGK